MIGIYDVISTIKDSLSLLDIFVNKYYYHNNIFWMETQIMMEVDDHRYNLVIPMENLYGKEVYKDIYKFCMSVYMSETLGGCDEH